MKNAQLRFQILAEIVAADRSEVELLAGLLGRILATFDYGDKVSLICETETLFNMFIHPRLSLEHFNREQNLEKQSCEAG